VTGRNNTLRRTAVEYYEDQYLNDDFQVDELDDDLNLSIYDLDTVLGYSVDIFKVGVPLLVLAFLLSTIIIMIATI